MLMGKNVSELEADKSHVLLGQKRASISVGQNHPQPPIQHQKRHGQCINNMCAKSFTHVRQTPQRCCRRMLDVSPDDRFRVLGPSELTWRRKEG
jgi:hypothetical protein